jgi:hypothetical protein
VTVLLLALPPVARAQTVIDILDGNTDVNQQEESEDTFNFSGDLLILEPVIQGYNLDDYAYVSCPFRWGYDIFKCQSQNFAHSKPIFIH